MNASTGGFDEALKALEDLESDVARQKDQAAVAPDPLEGLSLTPSLAFSHDDEEAASQQSAATDDDDDDMLSAFAQEPAFAREPSFADTSIDDLDFAPLPPMPHDALTSAPLRAAAPVVPLKPSRWQMLPAIAAGLGVFASLVSTIGLLVAVRTVNEASLVVADARERQVQLVAVGKLIGDLEKLRARQIELYKVQAAATASAPLHVDQFNAQMDGLRNAIGQRDPDQTALKAVAEQQRSVSDALTVIGTKLAHVEDRLSGH
jgi:hypothetical protein